MPLPHTGNGPRALWFTRPGIVEIREEAPQPLDEDGIRVRAVASGISQGTELLVLRGEVQHDLDLDLPTLKGSFGFPIKYGYASAGIVEDIGPKVTEVGVGDAVFVHHPHQDEFVVPASFVVKLPQAMSLVHATLLANMETAVNVMLDAHPRLGEQVVVFGQGVVGILVGRLLVRGGAAVTVVEPNESRARVAGREPAIRVVQSLEELQEFLPKMTPSTGFDLAIDCSGSPYVPNGALDVLTAEGKLVVVSWYGTKQVSISLGGSFHRKRLKLVSSQVGNIAPEATPRWNRRRRMEVGVQLLQELPVSDLVTHCIPFERAQDGYEILTTPGNSTLHVALMYGNQRV